MTDVSLLVSSFALGVSVTTAAYQLLLARQRRYADEDRREIDRLRARLNLRPTDPS